MAKGGARFGSGRPSHKVKAEHLLKIKIGRWHRGGYLRAGRSFTWSWHRGDEPAGNIGVVVHEADSLSLQYMVGSDDQRRDASQMIHLAHTACNYGKSRPWFVCPVCQRRAGVLFLRAGRFACRHCQRVAYSSQAEDAMARTWRLQRRIEETVGEYWQRPSGMRHRTFARLLDRLEACQEKRDAAFCMAAAGLLQRIDMRVLAP